MTDSRNSRKVRTGVVTSVSGAKTIVVTITIIILCILFVMQRAGTPARLQRHM